MSAKKSPSISAFGPAQRVTPSENSPAALHSKSPSSSLPKSSVRPLVAARTTPMSARPKRGVKFAQEEALRAFGGKSLGNVLTDIPSAQANTAVTAPEGGRVLTRQERREQEALDAFKGADLSQITNEVKQKLEDASAKHLVLVEQSSKAILRKKLEMPREEAKKGNTWEKDLSEVDFKPGLSRVERDRNEFLANNANTAKPAKEEKKTRYEKSNWASTDLDQVDFKPGLSRVERERLEYLASKEQQQQHAQSHEQKKSSNSDAVWAEDLSKVDFKTCLSKVEREIMEYLAIKQQQQQGVNNTVNVAESEQRAIRERDRIVRAQERKIAEEAKLERIRLAKQARAVSKIAPFMQQKEETKQIDSDQTVVDAVVQSSAFIEESPVVNCSDSQLEIPSSSLCDNAPTGVISSSVEQDVVCDIISSSIEDVSSSLCDKIFSSIEENISSSSSVSDKIDIVSSSIEEDVPDCATPGKHFQTALSSLVNSPCYDLNESMGELLDQISMDDLSAELTPNSSVVAISEEDVIEIQSSLQKRKTPIIRQPFYDAPLINDQLKAALEEISQQNENRGLFIC
jgi:hypothetical protein